LQAGGQREEKGGVIVRVRLRTDLLILCKVEVQYVKQEPKKEKKAVIVLDSSALVKQENKTLRKQGVHQRLKKEEEEEGAVEGRWVEGRQQKQDSATKVNLGFYNKKQKEEEAVVEGTVAEAAEEPAAKEEAPAAEAAAAPAEEAAAATTAAPAAAATALPAPGLVRGPAAAALITQVLGFCPGHWFTAAMLLEVAQRLGWTTGSGDKAQALRKVLSQHARGDTFLCVKTIHNAACYFNSSVNADPTEEGTAAQLVDALSSFLARQGAIAV
jgi:hypothetical protein